MKKSLIVCCSALLAFAVFAEEPAPRAEDDAPGAPRAERGPRGPRAGRNPRRAPLMLTVSEKTTDEEVEAFKKKVLAKIDASYSEYKEKAAPEGQEKPVMNMALMVMERRAGMEPGKRRAGMEPGKRRAGMEPGKRGPGMRGSGRRGPGLRGERGAQRPRRGDAGEKPAPEAEAR